MTYKNIHQHKNGRIHGFQGFHSVLGRTCKEFNYIIGIRVGQIRILEWCDRYSIVFITPYDNFSHNFYTQYKYGKIIEYKIRL